MTRYGYITECWRYKRLDEFKSWLRNSTMALPLLRNSGKICHPQNVGFDEIHEISFQGRWIYEDLESWTCEDLESWTCEALKSWTCEDLESWTCEALKSRICEDLNLELAKPWSRGPAKIWNRNLWNSEIYWRSNSEVMARGGFYE
jgi:hypothetical protein